ncbi:MAG TPA: histidinol-phosphate transaminase [Phycisphaerales bacterium]|nr:histidinol-phosphate transaminase [Phycisphaerales bacterium]
MSELIPEHIRNLQPYRAGRTIEEVQEEFQLDSVVKLASNENPLGPPESAQKAAMEALASGHRYPDPAARALRRKLAERYDLKLENIIVGAGSEGILASIVRVFLEGDDEVLTADAAFLGFPILCRTRGIEPTTVPLNSEYRFDLEALAEAITDRTKLIYLCNPNNPTGTIFTKSEFDRFMKKIPARVLVIQDEAYCEFAATNPEFPDSMDYRYDNVITLRTFSKAYGLAGFRVGYGFGHHELIEALWKVKLPFEPSGVAQAAALAALGDSEYLIEALKINQQGKDYLGRELRRLRVQSYESYTNFLMMVFQSEEQVQYLFLELQKRGVITRPLVQAGLPKCLRVSIGLPEENRRFVDALEEIVKGLPTPY